MVYQLLTGHLPFEGGPGQIMRQHFTVQPQPPGTLNPRLSPATDTVILRALAKRPEDRFAFVSDFDKAFQQALQSTGMRSPVNIPEKTSSDDLHATLAISSVEALNGGTRTLALPGGRRVSISIPAGARDGQTMRLEGLVESASRGGPSGSLILTLAVQHVQQPVTPSLPRVSGKQYRHHILAL